MSEETVAATATRQRGTLPKPAGKTAAAKAIPKPNDAPRFKETLARIVDAQYVEPDEADFEAGLYGSTIVLILRDLETDTVFTAPLPQGALSKIVRSDEELTSKKMVEFALALRAREAPVRVMMPLNGTQALTEEMIMATTTEDDAEDEESLSGSFVEEEETPVPIRARRGRVRIPSRAADYVARRSGRRTF